MKRQHFVTHAGGSAQTVRFLFRDLCPADAAAAYAFFAALSEKSASYFDPGNVNLRRTRDYLTGGDPSSRFFAAFQEGSGVLAGIAFLRHTDGACPAFGMAVTDRFQGLGLGTAFLKFVIETAKEDGFSGIVLRTAQTNLAAQRCYEKNGFFCTGTDTDGEFIYRLDLTGGSAEPIYHAKNFLPAAKNHSEAIERCLMQAKRIPGKKTVVFDGLDFLVNRAILIPQDTQIRVVDCEIRQKDGVFDNLFRGDNVTVDPAAPNGAPLSVAPICGVSIIGEGDARLCGAGKAATGYHPVLKETQPMVGDFWGWRTILISLSRCSGFEIAGLKISDTKGWALSFDSCENGFVHDLDIRSDVKNGDGVNFRSGCQNCRVEDIRGSTSDDTVACTALHGALKAFPHKNYLFPLEPYNSILPPEIPLDIHDISIKNVRTGGKHHGVICLAAEGSRVYRIAIENIVEAEPSERQAVVKIYTGYGGGYKKGDISDVSVKNVTANGAKYAVLIEAETENLLLENITHPVPENAVVHL